ncbi:MAG: ABC transporter ATP-binding protein [Thermodesulfobacteriota bacterium]
MSDKMLEIVNLKKKFGGVVAVDSLSLSINKGEVISLIGPNGAGKTTVFNLITGFLTPTSGNILFKGRELNHKKPHAVAAMGIGRTFQNVQVFSNMTVLENVMVGRHLRSRSGMLISSILPPVLRREENRIRASAEKSLHLLGLTRFADFPAGSLPLGNQRMLEIARALALEPTLLFLDEPASGLNARETMVMGGLIQKIKSMNITVVLVEHDMDLVMDISDRVAVVNFGRLIAEGTPKEVQLNPDVINAYLGT